jgi:hypothetical protein
VEINNLDTCCEQVEEGRTAIRNETMEISIELTGLDHCKPYRPSCAHKSQTGRAEEGNELFIALGLLGISRIESRQNHVNTSCTNINPTSKERVDKQKNNIFKHEDAWGDQKGGNSRQKFAFIAFSLV